MKFSLDKWGCHCSALLLSELLGMDIFCQYQMMEDLAIFWASPWTPTSFHHFLTQHIISLSFFIVQTKQSKLSIAGLDHQKVCRNFLWIQCTFEFTSKKLIHSSILSHNWSLLLLWPHHITLYTNLGNKQGEKLFESLYNNEITYTRMIPSHLYLSYDVYTCSSYVHPTRKVQ